jgi:hypothetical protein
MLPPYAPYRAQYVTNLAVWPSNRTRTPLPATQPWPRSERTVEAAPSADVRARLRLSLGRLLPSRGLT